jgi:signal transduction histidine kinase
VISVFLKAGRNRILPSVLGSIALIATADWAIGNRASLGLLYMLPMMAAATVLSAGPVVALATVCSALRSWFDIPAPQLEMLLRFVFAFTAYAGSGLFVIGLIRTRNVEMEHEAKIRREQELRREAEEQLRILVESSPAAIMTVDRGGVVLAANRAADRLLMLPENETLRGRPIGGYLPVLSDALQFDPGDSGLRAAAQCQGFRDNGEVFLANMWMSTWNDPAGKHLAAIVVDSSEDMRDREEESLRQMLRVNQIAAAAVSHEVRNLCGAISVVSSNLRQDHSLDANQDIRALQSLVTGLEKISSIELESHRLDPLEDVPLKSVLDDLRIIIEPQWREIGGRIRWNIPACTPGVLADRYGLLQAFLNLARNSHRAVQESQRHELSISARSEGRRVMVRFEDTGPGVSSPDRLFAPFQPGSDGTGLGLYVSRAVVRSYGGDLRWERSETGSCFVIELQSAEGERYD